MKILHQTHVNGELVASLRRHLQQQRVNASIRSELRMKRRGHRVVLPDEARVAGQLVVLESTTYPGTTRGILLPILESTGLRCGDPTG